MTDDARRAERKTIFSQEQLHELHQNIIAAGIAPEQLLAELDPDVSAILEHGSSSPADALLFILSRLNQLRLLDGSIPFKTVLRTACLLAGPKIQRLAFERALSTLDEQFQDRGPPAAPASGAGRSGGGSRSATSADSVAAANAVSAARRWLVIMSLAVTAATLVFFIAAPVLDYPLEYPENLRPMQIMLPVTLGYLGSMTLFVFRPSSRTIISRQALAVLGLMVKGPTIVFSLAIAVTVFAFGYSNRRSAPIGASHVTLDELSMIVTACLAVLTVSTNAMVASLFGGGDTSVERSPDA